MENNNRSHKVYQHIAFLISGFLLYTYSTCGLAQTTIPVWTYYPSPPFITGQKQGLSYEFIDLLNEFSKDQYSFELKYLPRSRLNRNLEAELPGLVLFVNWSWMGDKQKNKYLWSQKILSDQNEIVSRVEGKKPIKINFDGAKSLQGFIFGATSGRKYKGLESAIKKGDIIRQDARKEEQNLNLILRERIDFTSAAATVLRYKVKELGLQDKLHFSKTPMSSYTRHMLITKKLSHIKPLIDQFIDSLDGNSQWQSIKEIYSVN